tara:strand:+ start:60 stop:251 length:192 start_codon:yes stop_codon:yes gene_type:complete
MASTRDVWTVVLHEVMKHSQAFVDLNPMKYKGKELKAYTTGIGMISVLCKRMIEDIKKDTEDN